MKDKKTQMVWRVQASFDYEAPFYSKHFWNREDAAANATIRVMTHSAKDIGDHFEHNSGWYEEPLSVFLTLISIY